MDLQVSLFDLVVWWLLEALSVGLAALASKLSHQNHKLAHLRRKSRLQDICHAGQHHLSTSKSLGGLMNQLQSTKRHNFELI